MNPVFSIYTKYFIVPFELKRFGSRDITDRTLNEKDGLIESLRASKYTPYEDVSVPNLCNFPRYYVFVHNCLARIIFTYEDINSFVEMNLKPRSIVFS